MRKLHGFVSLLIPLLFVGLMPTIYRNNDGLGVHRPVKAQGSTAPRERLSSTEMDRNSFSQHRSGTCSHQEGSKVAVNS